MRHRNYPEKNTAVLGTMTMIPLLPHKSIGWRDSRKWWGGGLRDCSPKWFVFFARKS